VAPIQFEELLRDRSERQFEFAAVITAELHCEIGDGNQQRVFVSGDELTFGQQSLNVAEEGYLLCRRRGWSALSAHFEGGLG
jgi:hypothetical protein